VSVGEQREQIVAERRLSTAKGDDESAASSKIAKYILDLLACQLALQALHLVAVFARMVAPIRKQ